MSSSPKGFSNDPVTSEIQEENEFLPVVNEGRYKLENDVEFQTEDWAWTRDLDDEGIFIFCYLLHDYSQNILSLPRLEESVYTLNLLRHRMLPLREQSGLTLLGEYQVIFTLYEKLKQEKMSWNDCEAYITEQIALHKQIN